MSSEALCASFVSSARAAETQQVRDDSTLECIGLSGAVMRPDQHGKQHAGVPSGSALLLPGRFALSVDQDPLCVSETPANIMSIPELQEVK